MIQSVGDVKVGDNVRIMQKNGEMGQGMVRTIVVLREDSVIVDLINGSTGKVLMVFPKLLTVSSSVKTGGSQKRSVTGNDVLRKDIFSGENSTLEYKSSALWSQDLSADELEEMQSPEVKKYKNRASKVIIAKVLAGFMNTLGGDLIIGIREEKGHGVDDEFVGIESEFRKLKNKDYGEDGYKRMIMDDIIRSYFPKKIFNHFNSYFRISYLKKDGKLLCRVSVRRCEDEVFLTIAGKDYFFVRIDTQTRELLGKEIIDYIRQHFK
ncbi:MAG: hypothetical protein ACI83O_000778 [Patescibacteria group bacterium]|jgi:hypothetical protein